MAREAQGWQGLGRRRRLLIQWLFIVQGLAHPVCQQNIPSPLTPSPATSLFQQEWVQEPAKRHPLTQPSWQHCMVGALTPQFTDEPGVQRGAVRACGGPGGRPGLRWTGSPSRIRRAGMGQRPPECVPRSGLAPEAGLLGSALLRLGRQQPRALGQERGLGPKAGPAGGLSPQDEGGPHPALCLGALPRPAWGVLPQGRDAPTSSSVGGEGGGGT